MQKEIFPGQDTFYVGWEDISAACNCDALTVAQALNLNHVSNDAYLCRMKRTGKPHEQNFTGFIGEPLYKWTRLGELQRIVNEYIRTHPKTDLQK